jgi:putative chitinase
MTEIKLSKEQLQSIYKEASLSRIEKFIEPLNIVLNEFEINTPQRIRMFLAQIGHESGQLRYVKELASGEAYEGRKDLGNTAPGDGVRYPGRGLIQITGKRNHALCGLALNLPLLETPDLLEQPLNAARSAGWFWNNNNLNSLCDLGLFKELTKRINGGYNGYADRYKLYQRAFDVIK